MPDAPAGTGRRGSRSSADAVGRHVGARIRERRVMLGLSQPELAGLIGVAYQQVHKYETGINRLTAGRLHDIAQALGVSVGHFYEGLGEAPAGVATPTPVRRPAWLGLARDFAAIPSREQREALVDLARVLAEWEAGAGKAAAAVAGGPEDAAVRPAMSR